MPPASKKPPATGATMEGDRRTSSTWQRIWSWLWKPLCILGAAGAALFGLLFQDSKLHEALKKEQLIDRAWGYISAAPKATKEVHLWVLAILVSWFAVSIIWIVVKAANRGHSHEQLSGKGREILNLLIEWTTPVDFWEITGRLEDKPSEIEFHCDELDRLGHAIKHETFPGLLKDLKNKSFTMELTPKGRAEVYKRP